MKFHRRHFYKEWFEHKKNDLQSSFALSSHSSILPSFHTSNTFVFSASPTSCLLNSIFLISLLSRDSRCSIISLISIFSISLLSSFALSSHSSIRSYHPSLYLLTLRSDPIILRFIFSLFHPSKQYILYITPIILRFIFSLFHPSSSLRCSHHFITTIHQWVILFVELHRYLSSNLIVSIHKLITNSWFSCFLIYFYTIYWMKYLFYQLVDYYTWDFTKMSIFTHFPPKVVYSSLQLANLHICIPTETL